MNFERSPFFMPWGPRNVRRVRSVSFETLMFQRTDSSCIFAPTRRQINTYTPKYRSEWLDWSARHRAPHPHPAISQRHSFPQYGVADQRTQRASNHHLYTLAQELLEVGDQAPRKPRRGACWQ